MLGAEPRAPPLGPSPALMSAEPSGKRPFQLHLEALKRTGGRQPGCWGINLPPCWDSAPHFAAGVDKEQQEAEQTHPRAPGTHLTGGLPAANRRLNRIQTLTESSILQYI